MRDLLWPAVGPRGLPLAACRTYLTRLTYSFDRVSTLMTSPWSTNSGTRTTAPVDSLAGLTPTARGIAFDARVRFHDFELDEVRWLDDQW